LIGQLRENVLARRFLLLAMMAAHTGEGPLRERPPIRIKYTYLRTDIRMEIEK